MAKNVVSPGISIFRGLLRPNNATQYIAGDVIEDTTGGGVQAIFVNSARFPGGTGRIVSASLAVTANGTGLLAGDFELWLFDQAVASHESDAEPFTPTDADLINLVGVLQFETEAVFEANVTAGATGNVAYMAAMTFLPLGFACIATSRDLHATLVVRNGYTPTAFEQFLIRINIEQD